MAINGCFCRTGSYHNERPVYSDDTTFVFWSQQEKWVMAASVTEDDTQWLYFSDTGSRYPTNNEERWSVGNLGTPDGGFVTDDCPSSSSSSSSSSEEYSSSSSSSSSQSSSSSSSSSQSSSSSSSSSESSSSSSSSSQSSSSSSSSSQSSSSSSSSSPGDDDSSSSSSSGARGIGFMEIEGAADPFKVS